jgi:L-lactate dehydrogenase complex protein LldG
VVARPVSDARGEILERVRAALGTQPERPAPAHDHRGPGEHGAAGTPQVVDRFRERVAAYGVTVRTVGRADVADAIAAACAQRGVRRLGVAPGLQPPPGVVAIVDDPPLSAQALDELDGTLTGCALAIAETGTIALDGDARSGRRALTLVPDYHLCLVEAASIVASVPDAIQALGSAARDGRPITLVSGPSATSDIELERVDGVHGPRTLDVLIVVDE